MPGQKLYSFWINPGVNEIRYICVTELMWSYYALYAMLFAQEDKEPQHQGKRNPIEGSEQSQLGTELR